VTEAREHLWLPYDKWRLSRSPGQSTAVGLDWESFAVIVEESELHLLPMLLNGMDAADKRRRRLLMAQLAESHFSLHGILDQIHRLWCVAWAIAYVNARQANDRRMCLWSYLLYSVHIPLRSPPGGSWTRSPATWA
jgi:hypothetical protein